MPQARAWPEPQTYAVDNHRHKVALRLQPLHRADAVPCKHQHRQHRLVAHKL